MSKKTLFEIGLVLFVLGLTVTFRNGLLSRNYEFAFRPARPPNITCEVRIDDHGNRKVKVGESFLFPIHVRASSLACHSEVSFSAPAFDVSPQSEKFQLPDDQGRRERTFSFNLLPTQTGQQIIVVNADGAQYQLAYTIYKYPYIPVSISDWFGSLNMLFGSMLTLPYWIEFFRKRNEQPQPARRASRVSR